MDLAKILREAQADKPKQTRPNDASWLNNAIQFRLRGETQWKFTFDAVAPIIVQQTDSRTASLHSGVIREFSFVEGRIAVEALNEDNPKYEFRLVAILEVK